LFVIVEIMEQPAAISRALNYGGRILDESSTMLGGLDGKHHTDLRGCLHLSQYSRAVFSHLRDTANRAVLSGVHHLVIAACGTSYYAGIAGAQYMRHLNAFKTIQGTVYLNRGSSAIGSC
jgi:glucosamine 6-phosphate synthetase-like amidotransferase/phosphosugar isomerase protein